MQYQPPHPHLHGRTHMCVRRDADLAPLSVLPHLQSLTLAFSLRPPHLTQLAQLTGACSATQRHSLLRAPALPCPACRDCLPLTWL